jgi:hypothetical protein
MEIRDKLKNLPKIKASDKFENMLMQKINLAEAEIRMISEKQNLAPEKKNSFFKYFFFKKSTYWIIPALGSVAIVLIMFIIFNPYRNSDITQNSPVIQTLSDNVPGNIKSDEQKLKGDTQSEERVSPEKEKSDLDLKSIESKESQNTEKEKVYLNQDITIPANISPKSELRKADATEKDYYKTEKEASPVMMDMLKKIETKSNDESKSEGPVNKMEKKEENKVSKSKDDNTGKGDFENVDKVVEKKDKKVKDKKSNRAVSDSTDTIKKQLEKIRDSILNKEKNK